MISAGDFKCPCADCVKLGDQAVGISWMLAAVLNQMEVRFGDKLQISSGYRCPPHNKAIGGAPDSEHMRGVAADIVSGDSQARYKLVAAAVALGIPFVEVCPGHVHVDLRSGAKRLILGANG